MNAKWRILLTSVITLLLLGTGVTMAEQNNSWRVFSDKGVFIIQTADQATLTLTAEKEGKITLSNVSTTMMPQSIYHLRLIPNERYLGYWKPGKRSLSDSPMHAVLVGTYTADGKTLTVAIPLRKMSTPIQEGNSLTYEKVQITMRSLPKSVMLDHAVLLMSPIPSKMPVEIGWPL